MDNDLVQFLRARLDEDEQTARTASHVLRDGAHWSLDDWHGWEQPHSLIAQGTADQPVALGHFTADPVPTEQAAHIARHDPARVLREIDAKRVLLADYERFVAERRRMMGGWDSYPEPSPVLMAFAAVYADHSDYRDEWRP